jgi:hypothetical protein
MLADRPGRVLPAQVDARLTLADTQRDDDVAARAVEDDDDAARRLLAPLLDERELLEVQHVADTIATFGVRSAQSPLFGPNPAVRP